MIKLVLTEEILTGFNCSACDLPDCSISCIKCIISTGATELTVEDIEEKQKING